MPIHIVNLGSSFAAGPGIPPHVDSAAKRSGANYAHLLAKRLPGAKLTDLSVSGATLLNVLQEPQSLFGHTFPVQLDHVPEDADVVLILGGGNDLGYIGDLVLDSLRAYMVFRLMISAYFWFMGGGPGVAKNLDNDDDGDDHDDDDDAAKLTKRYGKVLDAIHAKAPKARVFVIEYLTLLGPDVKPRADVPLSAEGIARHQSVAETLRMATARALSGREAWCTRVGIAEPSWEHGIGSRAPWVVGFGLGCLWRKEAWYHPNAEGMKAVAEILYNRLDDVGLVGDIE